MAEVARLQKMPDLAKKLEEYQPQPDPMAMKEMELRIALLEAQVQNERAKAMENQVDVQLKQAKTQSELAKAKVASSEADLKDLSFLERESGQDVIKDLAKKDHDAMTKIELERMKGRGGAR
jgi:hypothetical protein